MEVTQTYTTLKGIYELFVVVAASKIIVKLIPLNLL